MGRPRFYRQNTINQINSVSQKSLWHWLVKETEEKFGMAPEEARLVALKGYNFLGRIIGRGESQIELELTGRAYSGRRQKRDELPQRTVTVTPVSFNDLEIHRQYGLKAMQNARLLRMVEEACLQGAVFDQPRLSMLTNITAKSIRSRLFPFLQKGIRLPLLGQKREYRENRVFRSTCALEEFFSGRSNAKIMAGFLYTENQWESVKLDFIRAASAPKEGRSALHPGPDKGLHPELAAEYAALAADVPKKQLSKLTQEFMISSQIRQDDPAAHILAVLQEEHNFSPAKARAYLRMLERHVEKGNQARPAGSIVYYAVSDREPPGKPLAECTLVPVQLSYVHQEDGDLINPDSTSKLKWQRILRYTTEAKSQGAYLSQPDLAYLLGVHPSVIQKQMREHAKVVVPTRGNLADMGPGISHMTRIVELYMQGYTETQIKHRTGHSYESIEAYLKNFSTYVGLAEQGMPKPLIRKAMGRSMRVVNNCARLYEKFNTPNYQWAFMKIRRIFQREEAAKKGAIT